MADYCVLQDVRDQGIDATIADDVHLQAFIDLASRIVDDYTSSFFGGALVETININDARLPIIRFPVLPYTALTSVTVNGQLIDPTGYTQESWGIRLYIPGFLDVDGFPRRTLSFVPWGYRGFGSPYGSNIAVTATFGHADIPLPVKQATVLIAKRNAEQASEQLVDPDIVQVGVEGYRLLYDRGNTENPLDTTGVVAADRLLQPYRYRNVLVA